ncbi:TonB-dependent receptor domain-containing protein [Sphingomonas quercus]|uniref:TonB-dependent receptor n=1 Tax=Sphingomonas quercus TaxID=2842451 RepID=A0ABS6BGT4_9SPHN|nr:TonB-dependent receptor [Sphingomonas quercus]MBU3077506.1 TonB-dependent receptor [Sphingomonas quercus]
MENLLSNARASRSRRRLLRGTALLIATAMPAAAAIAQQGAQAAPGAPGATTALDEIVVTGTSIRGVAPTGSNLISVGRDTITKTAPANASDIMSQVPQLGSFNTPSETSTPNRFRTPGFQPNIHNLGIYATLTLFNGHRFAAVGGEAVLPDPSIIPVNAIERVEVVADGASGVYGSDAVAGVVNFIYRRNVNGFEASGTWGFSPDNAYEQRSASALWGKTWSGGGVMVAYQYSDRDSPLQGDIDYLRLDQRFRGGRDLRTTVCSQPNVRIGSVTYAYPSFSTTANRCENALERTLVPISHRHAVLVTAHQEIGDRVELWTELNYSNYKTHGISAPRAISVTVPSTNPYFVLPPGVSASSVLVTRDGRGLFPNPVSRQSSEVMGITAGADIDLGGDWALNIMGHVSKTNDFNDDPEIDTGVAAALARGTTRTTAFNPFGQAADNDPGVLAQINNGYQQANFASQYLRELQAKADGTLFTMPGGPVKIAIGSSFRQEQAVQLQVAGPKGANEIVARDDDISRTVIAGFAEVHVPFFGPDNARPGLQRLELAVSGRYDYYDKLGGRFNPKFGLVWDPFEMLTLRGSYGTSFVAPNLGKITATFGGPQEAQTISGLGVFNTYNMAGGNPNLEPERAKTWSVGGDLKPARNLRLNATYFNVRYSNLIYQPSTTDLFFNPAFASMVIANPTAQQIADTIKAAPPVRPVPPTIDYIYFTYGVNLGVRKVAGLDLAVNYALPATGFGDFLFGLNATRFLTFKQEIVPGSGYTSLLDTNDAIKWRGRANLGWNLDPVSLTLFANYTGRYYNRTLTPNQHVKAWTTFDLVGSYKIPVLEETTLQVRISNLFDRKAPFYNAGNGYDARAANPFGRLVEATVRVRF